jgi:hypothetical protein
MHSNTQRDWKKLISTMHLKKRDTPLQQKFQNDPSRTRVSTFDPIETSLLERSQDFKYDDFGTKQKTVIGLPHVCDNQKKPRDKFDLHIRQNSFY